MQQQNPFQPFIAKMSNDLTNWIARQKQTKDLLKDYKQTISLLTEDFAPNQKLLIDHGQNIYSKAKTVDEKVVIRVKEGLFVEMDHKQATKTIKSLIELYEQKALVCEQEVAKIMTTMREVELLIQQFNNLHVQLQTN